MHSNVSRAQCASECGLSRAGPILAGAFLMSRHLVLALSAYDQSAGMSSERTGCFALSGLEEGWSTPCPGRCPGLVCGCPVRGGGQAAKYQNWRFGLVFDCISSQFGVCRPALQWLFCPRRRHHREAASRSAALGFRGDGCSGCPISGFASDLGGLHSRPGFTPRAMRCRPRQGLLNFGSFLRQSGSIRPDARGCTHVRGWRFPV